MIKIRTAVSETENKKAVEKISERKNHSFEMISKTNKLLVRLTKNKRKKMLISQMQDGLSLQTLQVFEV